MINGYVDLGFPLSNGVHPGSYKRCQALLSLNKPIFGSLQTEAKISSLYVTLAYIGDNMTILLGNLGFATVSENDNVDIRFS